MPSSQYDSLRPGLSLRRLRVAFKPLPPSPSLSVFNIPSPAPLSAASTARSEDSFFSALTHAHGRLSTMSMGSALFSRRIIRRKKSIIEIEQEEERIFVSNELVSLVEPRPSVGPALGGIEEVLDGRV